MLSDATCGSPSSARTTTAGFPLGDVQHWASQYSYSADDDPVIDAIAPAVRERGYFTRDEFLATYRWKTPCTNVLGS
jgi:hypothetical protein